MKKIALLLFLVGLFSCSKDPASFVEHIGGYWEIDEVTLKDGSKRTYTFNNTIDYIEVSDSLTGFRKKMLPNLAGKYETSKSAEFFKMIIENDSLNIYYKTPYSNWKETVLNANESQLLIINNTNKDVYLYKRYQPLDLD
ncbi:hypothetical protein [uncultured Psychroserpens sp.]|uniref:hypothetical protein n=1 Tax=uncultured Psychroserpens sp. TaxID=255436 RepID=UPI00261F1907|nr:hypothetical protein [uncultured Psychroserpens sp.]